MTDHKIGKSLWRIEPLSKPAEAHMADAVEMVGGEQVRRVSLPQLDYTVLLARNSYLAQNGKEPNLFDLAQPLALPTTAVESAMLRLAAAGIIPPPERRVMQ